MKSQKLFLCLVVIGSLYSVSALCLEFTVNTNEDTVDVNVVDGLCSDALGQCSLRAAIMQTNQFATDDVIYIPRSSFIVLSLVNVGADSEQFNDLDIRDDLVISIADPHIPVTSLDEFPVISGTGFGFNDRIFEIQAGGSIRFYGLGIAYGNAQNSAVNARFGGGVYVSSQVQEFELIESFVTLNQASFGGGIYSAAEQTVIKGSDISFNTMIFPNIILDGAGGAGLYHLGDVLTIRESSVHNNFTNEETGFIASAISLNGVDSQVDIFNSIVSDNGVVGDMPESIIDGISANNVNLRINNSNITGNQRAGIRFSSGSNHELFIRNSVLADNLHANCDSLEGVQNLGAFPNKGHNVSSDSTCQLPVDGMNLENTDPHLSQFQGFETVGDLIFFIQQFPLKNSVLIDRGSELISTGGVSSDACVDVDIRGEVRPQHGGISQTCDIGAFELDDLIFMHGFEAP